MRLLAILVLLLTFVIGTIGCSTKEEPKQANADPLKGVTFDKPKAEPPPPPQPPPQPMLQVKGNAPKGLTQNVRAAAYRPERLNELKQIGLFFHTFVDERNGKNPKSDEEFIDYIRRDSNSLALAIKEKYYILNLKVNMRDAGGVIAYESLIDGPGYQSVRVDGSVGPLCEDELKKLVLQQ